MSDFRAALRRLFQEDGLEVSDVFLDQVVGLAQGAVWDRDKARDAVRRTVGTPISDAHIDLMLDALGACVVPVPAHTIDRDALVAQIKLSRHYGITSQEAADRILALLRPVEGVVLSREEAALALRTMRFYNDAPPEVRALATRLEAAS